MLAKSRIRISHRTRSNRANRSASLGRSGRCFGFVAVAAGVMVIATLAAAGVATAAVAAVIAAARLLAAARLFAAAAAATALEHAAEAV